MVGAGVKLVEVVVGLGGGSSYRQDLPATRHFPDFRIPALLFAILDILLGLLEFFLRLVAFWRIFMVFVLRSCLALCLDFSRLFFLELGRK